MALKVWPSIPRIADYRPILDEVADPGAVACTATPGPVVRLVSVPDAVEGRNYPGEVEGSVALAVADPLADWNVAPSR